jgi:hypothetical protein
MMVKTKGRKIAPPAPYFREKQMNLEVHAAHAAHAAAGHSAHAAA